MSLYCKPRDLGCYKTGIPTADTNLIIPINLCVEELRQGDCFDFYIPCCFEYPATVGNVTLLINGTVSLFALKDGAVKSDQLYPRKRYSAVVGTEYSTATIKNCLPTSKFPYDVIDLTTTTIAEGGAVAPINKAVATTEVKK